jgi:pantoate--beta-alanine ligase
VGSLFLPTLSLPDPSRTLPPLMTTSTLLSPLANQTCPPGGTTTPQATQVIHNRQDLSSWRTGLPTTARVALVPTMGALHAGHQALIRYAASTADAVVVSVFVNPLQFGPSEDFEKYPRTLPADLAACQQAGAAILWAPSVEDLYGTQGAPDNAVTLVTPPERLTACLCGLSRPGHFTGVATVVMKLLQCVQPQIALFGEKDAQQLRVIQQMVQDLNLPVKIVPHPTVRDRDGLALSSRNRYLEAPTDRQTALLLPALLHELQTLLRMEVMVGQPFSQAVNAAQQVLMSKGVTLLPQLKLEYLELWEWDTWERWDIIPTRDHLAEKSFRLLSAAWVGNRVRLIDNLSIRVLP